MRNTKFANVLATTMSLAMLAGCATQTPGASVPGSVSSGTVSNNPGASGSQATAGNTTSGSMAAGGTTTTSGSASLAVVSSKDPNASTQSAPGQAADAAAEEDEVVGYNAVAEDDEAAGAPASYALEAVDATATSTATASDGATATATPAPTATATPATGAKKAKPAAKILTKLAQAKLKVIRARLAKERTRNLKRLRANEKQAVQNALKKAPWTDNGDGTETRHILVDVTRSDAGGTWTRHMDITRTIETDTHDLVFGSTDITENFKPGGMHTLHWEKSRQDDGSYDVTFHQVRRYLAPGQGPTRTADWDKTIDADGNVSGTGTITWMNKNGKVTFTETITFGGSEDRQVIADQGDTGTPETTAPQDGEATTPDAPAIDASAS